MTVTLSSRDLKKLERGVQILSSPLEFESVDDWRSAVNRYLIDLIGADSAGFLLPVREGLPMYSDEHDAAEIGRYTEVTPPLAEDGLPALIRAATFEVFTIEQAYGNEYDNYLRSSYYNEYVRPNGAHDASGMVVLTPSGSGPAMSSVQLWTDQPGNGRPGERELALLRLLYPAFRAGVLAHARWSRRGDDLISTLESLGHAAAVFDLRGTLLHATPELEDLIGDGPFGASLRAALRDTAVAVAEVARGSADFGADPADVYRRVRTSKGDFEVHGSLHGSRLYNVDRALVVVGVSPLSPQPPTPRELRERFGLTPRQSEVALLLAQRKTDPEIAELLTISRYTARGHVEAVMGKLGVNDRRNVGARIMGD